MVDFSARWATVGLLLGVPGQKCVLVVSTHIWLGYGYRKDAAEVGQLLLVETLHQVGQVGDILQLDHLLIARKRIRRRRRRRGRKEHEMLQ